jgi:cold shock CspA family protein
MQEKGRVRRYNDTKGEGYIMRQNSADPDVIVY